MYKKNNFVYMYWVQPVSTTYFRLAQSAFTGNVRYNRLDNQETCWKAKPTEGCIGRQVSFTKMTSHA